MPAYATTISCVKRRYQISDYPYFQIIDLAGCRFPNRKRIGTLIQPYTN